MKLLTEETFFIGVRRPEVWTALFASGGYAIDGVLRKGSSDRINRAPVIVDIVDITPPARGFATEIFFSSLYFLTDHLFLDREDGVTLKIRIRVGGLGATIFRIIYHRRARLALTRWMESFKTKMESVAANRGQSHPVAGKSLRLR